MALFDTFGFGGLFPRKTRAPKPTETVGVSGTAVYGGYLDSKETNKKLADPSQRYTLYSNLLANVSIIAAGVRYYLNLVGKATWKVEPAEKDNALAQEIADFIESAMKDMETPWPRVVRRAAMYKFYGFSIQEWTAKKRTDGAIGIRDVSPRPQHTIERWDMDPATGEVRGVGQRSPQDGQEIYLPRTKLVYAVDDSISDSPEGLGLLRNMVEPGLRLLRYQELEGFGFETDLAGVPVIRAPIAELNRQVKNNLLTQAEAQALLDPMLRFIQNHIKNRHQGLMQDSAPYQSEDSRATPSSTNMWDVELLKGESAESLQTIATAIERVTREIARIMNMEHLLLGGDGKGSLALSADKAASVGLMVDSTLEELEWVLRRDFVRTLVRLNGWPDELAPTLQTEKAQYRSVTEITQALVDLSTAGAPLVPGDPAIDEVRELLGLSGVPEEIATALIEAAMIGAEERARIGAGGAKPNEIEEEEGGEEPELEKGGTKVGGGGKPQAFGTKGLYTGAGGGGGVAGVGAGGGGSAVAEFIEDSDRLNGKGEADPKGSEIAPPFAVRAEGVEGLPSTLPEGAKIATVELDDLIATQPTLNVKTLGSKLSNAEGTPYVLQRGGEQFILDGHHRLAQRLINGQTKARVRLLVEE